MKTLPIPGNVVVDDRSGATFNYGPGANMQYKPFAMLSVLILEAFNDGRWT